MSDHCDDFSRAELLRATFASAGRGLPDVERGMPVPAGTGLSRRSFLSRAGGLALTVYGASAMGPHAWQAGIDSAAAAGSDRILVSVFLSGGLDAMSLLVPAGDPAYGSFRSSLAIAPGSQDAFRDDARLYWNPAAAPLRDLHVAGKLSVIPAIGYASPNQSHFTSRHFWEVGETDPQGRVGWLGRYLDRHGVADNPLQGLSLNSSLAPSLAPASVPVAAVSDPSSFRLDARDVSPDLRARLFGALGDLGRIPTQDAELAAARRATARTADLRDELGPVQGFAYPGPGGGYPDSRDAFPRRLASLARMISLGLPLRVVALNANGGYDTHDNQSASVSNNLSLLSRSLAAFQADLERLGVADRVLVHVWSEFGRRAKENGTGTDHGAGGASFVMGTRATGQTAGEWGGLGSSGVDRGGNLVATVDYRGVYASLLEQWLGVEADGIVPGASSFMRYALAHAA